MLCLKESFLVEVQRQVAAFAVGSTNELPEGLAYAWSLQLTPKAHATPMALLSRLSSLRSLLRSLFVRRASPDWSQKKNEQQRDAVGRKKYVCVLRVFCSNRENELTKQS